MCPKNARTQGRVKYLYLQQKFFNFHVSRSGTNRVPDSWTPKEKQMTDRQLIASMAATIVARKNIDIGTSVDMAFCILDDVNERLGHADQDIQKQASEIWERRTNNGDSPL
jgi:hypothetical protein